ncbi:MAG: right-handed parallel beta-helix repeat-containing protein [Candidatus Lokiarchaeota archaeon]|nr:right-handed parallel beta-helix repeat-containing protein [Candidatus Lokiarchaeota archaeon]
MCPPKTAGSRLQGRSKKKNLLVVLVLICTFMVTTKEPILSNIGENNKNLIFNDPECLGSWTLVSSIVIDELTPDNWVSLAASEVWCSGNGTFEDPYIIENIAIDGENISSCITISNSQVYFIIRNCTCTNSNEGTFPDLNAGIKLVNSSNGQILGNNCSNNAGLGIFLYEDCENNLVLDNNVSLNRQGGISLYMNCNSNVVANNSVYDNSFRGIRLYECIGNTVSENTVFNASSEIDCDRGIYVQNSPNTNILNNNVTEQSWEGFFVSNSSNCIIVGNKASFQELGSGFSIQDCFSCNISYNFAFNNSYYGMQFGLDTFNTIKGNTAFYNKISGLFFESECHNNTISENNVSFNENNGLRIDDCYENLVSENIIYDNIYRGIYLDNSDRNIVSKNLAFNNIRHGICVDHESDYNYITENTVYYNVENGIGLYDNSNYNTILENNASFNSFRGISLSSSHNNSIVGNIACYNTRSGIELYDASQDNTISENIICNNTESGIKFFSTENNIISENILKYNEESGINFTDFSGAYYNEMIGNALVENQDYGIYLGYFTDCNKIWLNSLVNNQVNNSCDKGGGGIGNSWENGTHGNYWSDYVGSFYENGTGMEPYNITNGATITNQDEHPLNDSKPIANFEFSHAEIIAGQSVQFSYTGTGGNLALTYEWDFGDGTPVSRSKNPSHVYSNNGTFTVNVSVIDATGDIDNFSIPNCVNVLFDYQPVAEFFANATQVIQGQSIYFEFNGSIGNGSPEFYWNFGDESNISNLESPVHRYDVNGTFTVSLVIVDVDGDRSETIKTDFVEIHFDSVPRVQFINSMLRATIGQSIEFAYEVIGGNDPLNYSWDFGDEGPVFYGPTPSHSFNTRGNYIVTLTVIDANGDMATANMTVIVSPTIVPPNLIAIVIFSTLLVLGVITILGSAIKIIKRKKVDSTSNLDISPILKQKTEKSIVLNKVFPKSSSLKSKLPPIDHKPSTQAEVEELVKTESELQVQAQEFLCVVHKGPVEGTNIYLCPHCKAFYCKSCANALKEKGESCWACGKDLEL